jgi:hypothetical protein
MGAAYYYIRLTKEQKNIGVGSKGSDQGRMTENSAKGEGNVTEQEDKRQNKER